MSAGQQQPRISPFLLGGFRRYLKRMLRRQFHGVHMAGDPPRVPSDRPLVVFMNHPSWWDPLLGSFAAQRFFAERSHYAPIDARALERYGILRRLGFFGIDTGRARGAKAFIDRSTGILAEPDRALWLTPEGEFTDPRERDSMFKPGLGHLALRNPRAVALPLAVEYPFWTERKPEALLRFGEPVGFHVGEHEDADAWSARLRESLAATQAELAEEARSRDPQRFHQLLGGRSCAGGVYDLFRRLRAMASRQRFEPEHASIRK